MIQGSCLCKSVAFKIYKETRKAVICHCTMCQKSNGEFSSYTKTKLSNFKLTQKSSLRLYHSSKNYRRGFCFKCGSSLFFQKIKDAIDIAISTWSLKKNISTIGHIYYQDKKSKLIIGKNLKKLKKSSDGIFDSYLFKIKWIIP